MVALMVMENENGNIVSAWRAQIQENRADKTYVLCRWIVCLLSFTVQINSHILHADMIFQQQTTHNKDHFIETLWRLKSLRRYCLYIDAPLSAYKCEHSLSNTHTHTCIYAKTFLATATTTVVLTSSTAMMLMMMLNANDLTSKENISMPCNINQVAETLVTYT